ncbi:MAG: 5-formyltetrahydrofolate cyclo-ligase [Cytophagia bacterium]|nr:5-formyltetrahydrofolate cyclo-ligase [Cytophagia bacterium]
MTKAELRKLYLQKRKQLSEAHYQQINLALYHTFFSSIDLSFIKTVHTFLPIREKHEPDTWPKINAAGVMENIYFEGLHQIEKSKWGIEEPRHGVPTPIDKIDLVLVPLLCFDAHGNRIGYGKGYYDVLLKACQPHCQKIGISLFDTAEVIDDLEAHDVALDAVLTPTGLLSFK